MNCPSHCFKSLDLNLLEQVRIWRNEPRVQRQLRSSGVISREAQVQWYERVKCDPEQKHFVLFQQNIAIGVLSFTQINYQRSHCEWGAYIGAERCWPGTGLVLEGAALDYTFDRLGLSTLSAEVFADNPGPQRSHKLFDFKQLGLVGVAEGRELFGFQHSAEQWRHSRPHVLNKLPDKITMAIESVRFDE